MAIMFQVVFEIPNGTHVRTSTLPVPMVLEYVPEYQLPANYQTMVHVYEYVHEYVHVYHTIPCGGMVVHVYHIHMVPLVRTNIIYNIIFKNDLKYKHSGVPWYSSTNGTMVPVVHYRYLVHVYVQI